MSVQDPRVLAAACPVPWRRPVRRPALAQLQTVRIGVTPGPHAQILEVVKPHRGQEGPRPEDRRVLRLRRAEPGARRRRAGGELVPEPALPRQPGEADRGYKIVTVGLDRELPDRHLLEEAQELRRGAERRDHLDPERPDQWRTRAAAAAGQGRDQAEAGRRLQADGRSTSSRTRRS